MPKSRRKSASLPKFTASTCPNGCLGQGAPCITTSKMRVEEALPCKDIPRHRTHSRCKRRSVNADKPILRQRSNCKQTDRNVIQILHRLQIHRQICHIRFSCRQGFCKCCRKQSRFPRHMQHNRKHKSTKNEDFSTRKSPRFYIYFLFFCIQNHYTYRFFYYSAV